MSDTPELDALEKAAANPRRIDLDAARAARAEVEAEPIVVIFGGNEFVLPVEMPARFAILAARGDIVEAVDELLESDDGELAAKFWAQSPTIADLEVFADGIAEAYGVDLGESRASARSSSTGGTRSRPTSRGGTRKT